MAAAKVPDHLKFAPGHKFDGQFQIISGLGTGGAAIVYHALDTLTHTQRALKFPLNQRREDFDALRREMQVGKSVQHPNLCKTFDAKKAETGVIYGVMEYIAGENLLDVINLRGRGQLADRFRWAIQLCAGLGYLHDATYVHGDLKLQNLMIDGTGNLKITDFGQATHIGTSIGGGTWKYMAPEQLVLDIPPDRLKAMPALPESDMYAVGVILYELFTGCACLEGDTPLAIAASQKTLNDRPPSVVADVPDEISRAIMSCFQKDAGARPTAELFRQHWKKVADYFKT